MNTKATHITTVVLAVFLLVSLLGVAVSAVDGPKVNTVTDNLDLYQELSGIIDDVPDMMIQTDNQEEIVVSLDITAGENAVIHVNGDDAGLAIEHISIRSGQTLILEMPELCSNINYGESDSILIDNGASLYLCTPQSLPESYERHDVDCDDNIAYHTTGEGTIYLDSGHTMMSGADFLCRILTGDFLGTLVCSSINEELHLTNDDININIAKMSDGVSFVGSGCEELYLFGEVIPPNSLVICIPGSGNIDLNIESSIGFDSDNIVVFCEENKEVSVRINEMDITPYGNQFTENNCQKESEQNAVDDQSKTSDSGEITGQNTVEESSENSNLEEQIEQIVVDDQSKTSDSGEKTEQNTIDDFSENSILEEQIEQIVVDDQSKTSDSGGKTEQNAVEDLSENSTLEEQIEQIVVEDPTENSNPEEQTEQIVVEFPLVQNVDIDCLYLSTTDMEVSGKTITINVESSGLESGLLFQKEASGPMLNSIGGVTPYSLEKGSYILDFPAGRNYSNSVGLWTIYLAFDSDISVPDLIRTPYIGTISIDCPDSLEERDISSFLDETSESRLSNDDVFGLSYTETSSDESIPNPIYPCVSILGGIAALCGSSLLFRKF
ncbi:MAG TPA: hypothetical protein O0W79_03315 [Methanocorpusculum sp.]|nr:hypothetical protein [Methanocorpusculum sp.]